MDTAAMRLSRFWTPLRVLAVGLAVSLLLLPFFQADGLPSLAREGCFDFLRSFTLALGASLALRRAHRCPEGQARAWRALAWGLGLEALSYLSGVIIPLLHLRRGMALSVAIVDAGNAMELVSFVFLLLGLLAWPQESAVEGRRARFLNSLMVTASVLFILLSAFPYAIGHLMEVKATMYLFVNLAFIFSFLFSVALLALLVLTGGEAPPGTRLAFLALGGPLAMYGLAKTAQGILIFGGRSYESFSWTEWAILGAAWLMAAGSLWEPAERERTPSLDLLGSSVRLGLPYLPVAAALAWGAWLGLSQPERIPFNARLCGAAVVGLLALRQVLALQQLQAFNRNLEFLVTERTKALEESLAALLRTQRMNMVATLGAGLAHDFKNLLTVIMGKAELVQITVEHGGLADPEALEAIQDTAQQAGVMVQHLLAIGRRQESQPEAVDLGEQVRDFQPLLQRLVPAAIQVVLDPQPVALPVHADPLQIEQILVNLVSNARDAMPTGGTIRIRTRLAEQESSAGPSAVLEVEDSGTGMPPEVLSKIFDPFFSTKAPGKGTGLGLASVKAILESCGGRIQARSEPGRGSAFQLKFPLLAEG